MNLEGAGLHPVGNRNARVRAALERDVSHDDHACDRGDNHAHDRGQFSRAIANRRAKQPPNQGARQRREDGNRVEHRLIPPSIYNGADLDPRFK